MTTQMSNPVFARFYSNLIVRGFDRGGGAQLRDRLLAGLDGTVVEVGAGDGANFGHYPAEVGRVVAVEPDPYLRARATERAVWSGRIEVIDADAARLGLADGSVDAVVFCLVLCSVPDATAALHEAGRVLRPGGQVRFLEHVRDPESARTQRVQAVLDATIWPRLFGGCHCGRDTAATIADAGLVIDQLEAFRFPEGSRLPMSPAIIGTARSAAVAR